MTVTFQDHVDDMGIVFDGSRGTDIFIKELEDDSEGGDLPGLRVGLLLLKVNNVAGTNLFSVSPAEFCYRVLSDHLPDANVAYAYSEQASAGASKRGRRARRHYGSDHKFKTTHGDDLYRGQKTQRQEEAAISNSSLEAMNMIQVSVQAVISHWCSFFPCR